MSRIQCFLLLSQVFLVVLNAKGQTSFFSNLLQKPPERIVLTAQWDSLSSLKDESTWDGSLAIVTETGTEEWKAEYSVRGRFRRSRCAFPPLEINLKKGALKDRGFSDYDKLKLVTHCGAENGDPADLYEEMLIYRLYSILTPVSYKVIPLKVDYIYPNGKTFDKNMPALLLEPTAELTARIGGKEIESYGMAADSLDAVSYARNALFQFMVGNFDWDPNVQRNVKMIGPPGSYWLIPYDFDFSAIVYPIYARMPSDFGLKDFRDRIYLGSYHNEYVPQAVQELLQKKDTMLKEVENYEYLSKARRREIMTYLDHFFTFVEDAELKITHGTVLPYKE